MSAGENSDLQTGQSEYCLFGAGIAAVEVFAGVGFGLPAGLRFFDGPR